MPPVRHAQGQKRQIKEDYLGSKEPKEILE